jgi:hypothetical protein
MRQWYSGAITGTPHLPDDLKKQKSDHQHAFFIGVLQNVREILTPRYSTSYIPPKQVPSSMNDIVNMFEHLDVEEPSGSFQQVPDAVTARPDPVDAESTFKAETLASQEEDFFAFYLLLSDFNKIRTEVKRTWEGYKQGLLDLVAVSITTNTAVDLARSLEDDCKHIFERQGGSDQMLAMYFHGQCLQNGTKESYKVRPRDEMNFTMYEVADSICVSAFLWNASETYTDYLTLSFIVACLCIIVIILRSCRAWISARDETRIFRKLRPFQ